MDPLFGPGEDFRLNACLNYGLDQWDVYAAGYREAAEVILDHVRTNHADQDCLIYPFLFLWRHHIELMLKGLGLQAAALLDATWAIPSNHGLERLSEDVRSMLNRVLEAFSEKIPRDESARFSEAISVIARIDPKSMVFRYPEDLHGRSHLEDVTHINFDVVARHMAAMSDDLEASQMLLSLISDYRRDSLGQ